MHVEDIASSFQARIAQLSEKKLEQIFAQVQTDPSVNSIDLNALEASDIDPVEKDRLRRFFAAFQRQTGKTKMSRKIFYANMIAALTQNKFGMGKILLDEAQIKNIQHTAVVVLNDQPRLSDDQLPPQIDAAAHGEIGFPIVQISSPPPPPTPQTQTEKEVAASQNRKSIQVFENTSKQQLNELKVDAKNSPDLRSSMDTLTFRETHNLLHTTSIDYVKNADNQLIPHIGVSLVVNEPQGLSNTSSLLTNKCSSETVPPLNFSLDFKGTGAGRGTTGGSVHRYNQSLSTHHHKESNSASPVRYSTSIQDALLKTSSIISQCLTKAPNTKVTVENAVQMSNYHHPMSLSEIIAQKISANRMSSAIATTKGSKQSASVTTHRQKQIPNESQKITNNSTQQLKFEKSYRFTSSLKNRNQSNRAVATDSSLDHSDLKRPINSRPSKNLYLTQKTARLPNNIARDQSYDQIQRVRSSTAVDQTKQEVPVDRIREVSTLSSSALLERFSEVEKNIFRSLNDDFQYRSSTLMSRIKPIRDSPTKKYEDQINNLRRIQVEKQKLLLEEQAVIERLQNSKLGKEQGGRMLDSILNALSNDFESFKRQHAAPLERSLDRLSSMKYSPDSVVHQKSVFQDTQRSNSSNPRHNRVRQIQQVQRELFHKKTASDGSKSLNFSFTNQ